MVLGSGLGPFVDQGEIRQLGRAMSEIEGLPVSKVPGHAGTLHCGKIGGVPVAVAKGTGALLRGLVGEGGVFSGSRLFHQMGVKVVVLTNAAGIVNANFKPGKWMLLSDHINMTGLSPLTGSASFIDQSGVYSKPLRCLFREMAQELGLGEADGGCLRVDERTGI